MNMEHFEIYSEKIEYEEENTLQILKKEEKTILMCHGFAGIQDLFSLNMLQSFPKKALTS